MSSSLRNFLTVAEALDRYGANAVRTFLLSARYSAEQHYSTAALEEAADRYERLEAAHERATDAVDSPAAATKATDEDLRGAVAEGREAFADAMNDDFNTREALAALSGVATAINAHLSDEAPHDYRGLREAVEAFEELGEGVLGLAFEGAAEGEARLASDLVELVLETREREREAGNYDRADELRDALAELGVEVQDTDDGPTYRL